MSGRLVDRLGAAALVVSSGALLAGWVVMYPVSVAPGGLLERITAEESAWDLAHRLLVLGAIALVAASLALWRALHRAAPVVTMVATVLLAVAGVLSVGQYALDYAVLAAADMTPSSGSMVISGFIDHPFVALVFYDIADLAWSGLAFLAVAMWMQRTTLWRVCGAIVVVTVILRTFDGSFGVMGPRIAHGVQFVAFTLAAVAMIHPRATHRPS